MKAKRFAAAFTACIMIISALCGLSVFLPAKETDEGREATAFPAFFSDGRPDPGFGSALSDYIADRLPFRSLALSAYGKVRSLFGESISGDVVFGKNDMFFFGDTVDSFTSLSTVGEAGILAFADALEQIAEYCEENGVKFVFAVAPNKNTVYPELMPARFVRTKDSDLDKLARALKNTRVDFVDLREKLHGDGLYYLTDSHWNYSGAVIAAEEILGRIGLKLDESLANAETKTVEGFVGDITEMLPYKTAGETANEPQLPENYDTLRAMRSVMDNEIVSFAKRGSMNAVVYRDSFGNALFPLFANTFGKMTYLRTVPVDVMSAVEDGADALIWEIVERRIPQALNSAPRVPAKETTLPEGETSAETVAAKTVKYNDYVRISGASVPDAAAGDKMNIALTRGNETAAYRAFGMVDNELVSAKPTLDGFTAYVPAAELEGSEIRLAVEKSDGSVIYYNLTVEGE